VTAPELAAVEAVEDWCRQAGAAGFPYRQVVAGYLQVGKHHVAGELLRALVRARTLADPADPLLRQFLDVALDKVDGVYDYPSYTGLVLLPLPATGAAVLAERDRLLCLLMSDLLDFEDGVRRGSVELLPGQRPDERTVAKRVHLGLRILRAPLARLGSGPMPPDAEPVGAVPVGAVPAGAEPAGDAAASEAGPDEVAGDADEVAAVRAFLRPWRTEELALRLRLSMLPVYTVHDEYLFIRCLQMFEVTFGAVAAKLGSTITAIGNGDVELAESQLHAAGGLLEESAPLFSLLATMQVQSFRTFRDFTEGASAIQSRGYKTIESLCREPDPDRRDSAAYESVPEVRTAVLAGRLTIDEAYRQQCLAGRLSAAEQARLRAAAGVLAERVMRWKRTHYSIAVRMLGHGQTGTGYTEGTPYLASVRNIPIFRNAAAEPAPELISRSARD